VPDFGRVFLMLKYTDITQNTYVQSWTVMEIMAREKSRLLPVPGTAPVSWRGYLLELDFGRRSPSAFIFSLPPPGCTLTYVNSACHV
jgi:hypothetical protein